MRLAFVLAIVAASLRPPMVLARAGAFQSPLRLQVQSPVAAAAGDFNRDGRLDLAVVNATSEVAVLIQDASDRNLWVRAAPVQVGINNYSILAADVDGDGRVDLLLADPGSTAYVLLSRGDGSFGDALPLVGANGARAIAVGDWDRDGKLDLALTSGAGSFSTYLGRGDGRFGTEQTYPVGSAHDLEALDFDGDGLQDLMVKVKETGSYPYRSLGNGRFAALPLVSNLGVRGDITSGDFDGDGKGDLLTDYGVGISRGDGTFRKTLAYDRPFLPLVAADLNGDGAMDPVVPQPGGERIDVHPGKGDGTFLPPVAFGMGGPVVFLTARDLDGDGRLDLVALESEVSILWGKAGERFLTAIDGVTNLSSARGLGLGDLDRDGWPDLIFSNGSRSEVEVHFGPGKLSPSLPRLTIRTSGIYSLLEAVDLDGDGVVDLAGANLAAGTLLVTLLDPPGRVKSETVLPAGQLPSSVATGAIDGDSNVDIALSCQGADAIAVFLGRGAGAFSERRLIPTLAGPRRVALADLDGDRIIDLAVVSSVEIAVQRGTGDGSFLEPVSLGRDLKKSYADVAVGDMDQDGLADLVVAESADASILFLSGKGGGQFETARALPLSEPPSVIVLWDLDRNGFPDIAAAGRQGKSVSVLPNLGGRRYEDARRYALGLSPLGHRLADLDLDGAPDLVAFDSSKAVVLLGVPPGGSPFRRGDVDSSGKLDVSDPIVTLNYLFLGGGAAACPDAADSNDDGVIDLADAIALLNRLFLGGAPLPLPGPESCGEDPTIDRLAECRASC